MANFFALAISRTVRTPANYSMPMRLASNCCATSNNRMRQENRVGRARVFFRVPNIDKTAIWAAFCGQGTPLQVLRPVDKTRLGLWWPCTALFLAYQAISCVGIYFGIYFRSLLRNCSAACALTLYSGVHSWLHFFRAEILLHRDAAITTHRSDGAGRTARGARAPLRPGPGPRPVLP